MVWKSRILSQPKTSLMTRLPRKSTPIATTITMSRSMPRRKPGPPRKPKMSLRTTRIELKSWLAKTSSTAVRRRPERRRRRMIAARASWSSFLYTGTIAESWLRTASITVRRLSTKPAPDTKKKSTGMRPTMKLNASPEARNIPRRARKFAAAVLSAPITSPRSPSARPLLHDAPDQAAVHLHRGARDVGRTGGGEEDHHRGELLRRPDPPHRDVGGGQDHLLLHRDARALGPVGLVLDEPVGQDAAGQYEVDRDVVLGQVSRERLEEARDPGPDAVGEHEAVHRLLHRARLDGEDAAPARFLHVGPPPPHPVRRGGAGRGRDRKSTRLNSRHLSSSYSCFCL